MAEQGAAIIDIGGESTRPGATAPGSEEEIQRVLPVVERVAARLPLLISVDTSNPELMRRAADAGAHLINDVRALRAPGAMEAAAAGNARGLPDAHARRTRRPCSAIRSMARWWRKYARIWRNACSACVAAGIERERLCVDPGFGFGKTTAA